MTLFWEQCSILLETFLAMTIISAVVCEGVLLLNIWPPACKSKPRGSSGQILGNMSHFHVEASRIGLNVVSDCLFFTHRDVNCALTRMEPSREQTMEVHTPHTHIHHTHLFWTSGAFMLFMESMSPANLNGVSTLKELCWLFVVCVASIHHPCQSVFYDCVYVYEGADQDAYSARPVRSLLVGFIGRSGW